MNLRFVSTLARRELRAQPVRLGLHALSIAVGVAALVAVSNLRLALQRSVAEQAQALLGSDLMVSSRRPLPADVLRDLRRDAARLVEETSFRSMLVLPAADASRLVQVRAFDGAFPLHGQLGTAPAEAAAAFQAPGTALVDETLLHQFAARVGDAVRLGTATLHIAGALLRVPGEAPAESFIAPRVFIARADLPATGLLQPGAVLTHRAHLLLKPGVEADEIRGALKARQLDAQSVASRQADLIKGAEGIAQFLGLTGLAALLLGGLGVAAAAHTYAQERAREVALLRCLGATGGEAVLAPLLQVGALTALAAGLGALGGTALAALAGPALRHWLAVEMPRSASLGVALEGGLTGLACGLLFALGPLLALRRVPPLAGLRAGAVSPAGRGGAGRWMGGVIALAVLAYAVRQAAVWWHGVLFAAGLGLALGLLAGAALLLRRLGRALARRGGPFALRQAAANLYRPQNQTVVLVVSLGLGVWLLATQQFAAATLLRPLRLPAAETQPNLVLVDVQTDQRDAAAELLRAAGVPALHVTPIVPMRIESLRDRPVSAWLDDRGAKIPDWTLKREYRSTYRDTLGPAEQPLRGDWPPAPWGTNPVPVSIERDLARDLRVDLGDRLVFDVQGQPVEAAIAQVRTVDWKSMQPNFFFLFPPGVLEPAPQALAVFTRVEGAAGAAALQRAVAERLPNVSCLDLAMILDSVRSLVTRLDQGVRVLSGFTLAAGLVVLVGALRSTRSARRAEQRLLRTLGASRGQLRALAAAEFALVGGLAAGAGLLLAVPTAAALARWVFRTELVLDPEAAAGLAVGLVGLGLLLGLLDDRRLVRRAPLAEGRSGGSHG